MRRASLSSAQTSEGKLINRAMEGVDIEVVMATAKHPVMRSST